MIALQLLSALVLDRLLGEPSRLHPLVGFGRLATGIEKRLNPTTDAGGPSVLPSGRLKLRGSLACVLLVVLPPLALGALLVQLPGHLMVVLAVLVLYLCIGYRSLVEHCRAVAMPLGSGDLAAARSALAMIVSRDTQALDEPGLARGTLESLLENGSDAVIAPLFWFALAGAPGALFYRLANTLDAMWGYRSQRYRDFGWCAARLDDVLNWLPARLCALCYALVGHTREALGCWSAQASQHDSPNAGPVMASGAGALGVVLGGDAVYRGEPKWRPQLGRGRAPAFEDIESGIILLTRSLVPGLILVLLIEVFW